GAVKKVRIFRRGMAGQAEPTLQQRSTGRDDEERQADQTQEQPQERKDRIGFGRRRPRSEAERQHQKGQRQQHELDDELLALISPGAERVGISIADEQDGLEEDHAGVPNRRSAAEFGQDHLADQGLHEKQKGGADEQSEREIRKQAAPPPGTT